MSAFEQKVEPQNPAYQYILFAAEPYETVGFKIPNLEIERDLSSGKFFYDWDQDKKSFTVSSSSITGSNGDSSNCSLSFQRWNSNLNNREVKHLCCLRKLSIHMQDCNTEYKV